MTLVVVDDEKNALENMEQTLAQVPEASRTALFDNGRDALNYLARNKADAALLDIEMRGMGGLELAKRIRERHPETGVIFVTGYTQYALEAIELHASGYIVKPAKAERIRAELLYLRNSKFPAPARAERLRVQCFGNFEVFMEGKPLVFRYSKSKELLAYLVDRKGAAIPSDELIAVLWEDKPVSASLRSQLRNSTADLSRALSAVGMEDVLIKTQRSFYVDTRRFYCDYYQFLKGDAAAVNTYRGEYMSQYSWAEMTTGGLSQAGS